MHELKRPARDRGSLLLAAAAALGAGLVLLRQARYGPGMGWDAVNYITAARNLLAGEGLVDLHGPLVSWPPLYPTLLAAGGLFGLDPHAVAGPLNAVLFGLTVLVAGRWLRRHLHSRFLWLWGCLALALALPLAAVASEAMSEPAFILCVTLALTQIDAHLDGGGRGTLLRAAAYSALACLTRYLGASVLLAVVPLLLAAPGVAPREKVQRITVYVLIAAAPVGLWILRNLLVADSTTGPRGKVFYSLPFIVEEAWRIAVGDWWLVGVTAPVLVALGLAAGHAFCRRWNRQRGASAAAEVAWGPLRVCSGFALAYLALLVTAMMGGGTWSGLQERFLAPVYVPLLCAALLLMDGALRYARRRAPRGIVPRRRGVLAIGGGKTLAAVLMVALSLQAARLVVLHEREMRLWQTGERHGYAAPWWRNSESVQYIREVALTGAILSHAPPVTSLYAAEPARHDTLPCEPDRLRSALAVARDRGAVHVLHFRDWQGGCSELQHDDLGSALAREPLLEPVAALADGTLYRLRDPASLESRSAMFHSADAPVVGQSFTAFLNRSRGRRLPGAPWRWEKGSDADGWTPLPVPSPTHVYTPTVADVGHRLRASVYYADPLGNRVKATTAPSAPVQPEPGLPKVLLVPPGSADGRGAASTAEADRSIRARYAVYLRGNRLLYENRSCIWEDEYGTRFPLIVYALDAASGTPERDTLDFAWHSSSWQMNGTCVIEHRLPDQDLFGIRTGQVDRDGNLLWEAEHWFKEQRRWLDGYLSSATSGALAARGVFDIHLGDGRLIFVKEPCARADTEARFFLHLVPADMADLPDHRQQYGFDNLDFAFEQHGERFEGTCLATVPLPEYGISAIRTGQYVPVGRGFNNVWEAEFRR